eukprot:m.116 g.116  ORF g.116 m.116 type:complete len:128 (-) comp37_c0_seq1:136-519(-)
MSTKKEIDDESANTWLLDSGATSHISNDETDCFELHPDDTVVEIADGTEVKALGRGHLKLPTEVGTVKLTDVLLMPKGFQKILVTRTTETAALARRTTASGIHELDKCLSQTYRALIQCPFKELSMR